MSQVESRQEALRAAETIAAHLGKNSEEELTEASRVSALESARKLVAALEKPQDALLRFAESVSEPPRNLLDRGHALLLIMTRAYLAGSMDGDANMRRARRLRDDNRVRSLGR